MIKEKIGKNVKIGIVAYFVISTFLSSQKNHFYPHPSDIPHNNTVMHTTDLISSQQH
jgi:hypothetical protein